MTKGTKAVVSAMLVYFDEPQVILLEQKDDHKIISVAINKERYEFPFLGAEINEKQWERYCDGSVDLRYLFLFPQWKKWYIFDLRESENKQVTIYRAQEEDYKNEELLPVHGFFSKDHTEPDLDRPTIRLEPQKFSIDGSWDLSEFSQFYNKFTNLYSFFLSLRKFENKDTRLDLKKRIREAFAEHPLKGGSSYVNLYGDLFTVQERRDRLSVQSIRYASPGHVAINGRSDVFGNIAQSLSKLETSYDSIKSKYGDIYKYLQKNKLLKAEKDRFDTEGPIAEYLYDQCEDFADLLAFSELELMHGLTGKNSLLTAKVLLSYFRRLDKYYMFFAEGRVTTQAEGN